MQIKTSKLYPVTIGFEAQPGLEGLHPIGEVRKKFEENLDLNPWVELTTQSIVVIPNGINPIKYLRNFLLYINQISHTKEVLPSLYDAGYIPYVLLPQIAAAKPLLPNQCLGIFKTSAAKAGVSPIMYRGKYFADSSTSASYTSYWVTRKEAAKIINSKLGSIIDIDNTSVTDSITSIQVLDAIFGKDGENFES